MAERSWFSTSLSTAIIGGLALAAIVGAVASLPVPLREMLVKSTKFVLGRALNGG
jgi:hypothetical protein